MTIEPQILNSYVSDTIYKRGVNYYNEGRIYSYNINEEEEKVYLISAHVRGTRDYEVKIYVEILEDDIFFNNNCNCPYDWGDICKHVVAVMYRFLKEDYQQVHKDSWINENYNKLLELSEIEEDKPRKLTYQIKGFLDQNLKNFKLVLKSDYISDPDLNNIVENLNENFYIYNREDGFEHYFSGKELEYIERLRDLQKSKGRARHSLLLNKDYMNLEFLLDLIDNFPVTFMENNTAAHRGDVLKPELLIEGDCHKVEFKVIAEDYDIYSDQFEMIYWTVIDNVVHPVDLEGINELPEIIEIPDDRQGEFLFEILPGLKENLSLQIGGKLAEYELIREEPEVKVKLDYVDHIIHCDLRVEFADEVYNNSRILGLNLEQNAYNQDEDDPDLWYGRDNRAFARVIEFMEDYNFKVKPDKFIIKNRSDIQEFITDGIVHIPEEWEVETSEAFDKIEIKPVELEPIIEVDDSEGINWFDFKITYNLGGKSYSRKELQAMISYNNRGEAYIQQGNQYFILQQGKKEKKVEQMLNLAEERDEDSYRSSYYNLLYYKNLVQESGITFKGSKVYDELERNITSEKPVAEKEVPAQVAGVLRDYQERGYYWLHFLHKYHFGGILADDMGLGKTLQILTLLRSLSLTKPALVVCPRTLIYNWQEEVEKFFPDLECLVYYGTPEERDEMRGDFNQYQLLVTSYSIISRDFKKLNQEGHIFSFCILDEAQHIKNYKTKRARAVKSIRAEARLSLTGTPLENSVAELWSIFDFLMPGYLGNYNNFRKKYFNPIKKNNDRQKIEELKQRVAPFILRRKKEEVLQELPEKIVNIQPVNMTKLQEDTYRVILDEVKGNILQTVKEKGFNRSRINVLAALTKLRQICNHPGLILDKKGLKQNSGKMEVLEEIVSEAISGGHKVIVFSQFVKMLKLIKKSFRKKDINFEYLDGSTRNRMERVNDFNNQEEIKVFLISLKAGGIGLNLTAADMVIHVDPWWNPMVERQATDRAHRLGQENRVMVYKLITRGTVEEKMLKLQRKKQDIFDNIIEDNKNPLSSITWEDIRELLDIS